MKNIKKNLQDEMAGAILLKMGAPLSIAEHEDLVSKINLEAAQILEETLEARDVVFDSMFLDHQYIIILKEDHLKQHKTNILMKLN